MRFWQSIGFFAVPSRRTLTISSAKTHRAVGRGSAPGPAESGERAKEQPGMRIAAEKKSFGEASSPIKESEAQLMNYDFSMECGCFDNAFAMTVLSGNDFRQSDFFDAGEKFCEMGANGFSYGVLGWQLVFDRPAGSLGYIFSTADLYATPDDYRWILRNIAEISEEPVRLGSLTEGSRCVYALIPKTREEAKEDGLPSSPLDHWVEVTYDLDDYPDYGRCRELIDLLAEAGAVVRITTGVSYENNSTGGNVLISLPGEMTLRMRCSILRSFPFVKIKKIDPGEGETKDAEQLSVRQLRSIVASFLCDGFSRARHLKLEEEEKMAWEKKAREKGKGELKKDSRYDVDIDVLDLSVRAYNCLKRGNIHTLQDLRLLDEEDLLKIRNLGQRAADEVREKFAAFERELAENKKEEEPEETKTEETKKEEAEAKAKAKAKAEPQPMPKYMDKLDGMIGLENVKKQIRKIAAFAKMKKELSAQQDDRLSIALNMEFVGNPGTAKTTVARIVAGILHEIGLLPEDGLVEVGRADLVGQYVGHTAPLVKEVFQKAKGKVLFIDEAYSLATERCGGFGDEAINTIVQEMENHRSDTVVIFAGYQDKMKAFIDRNPGLRSRVPFRVEFQDYDAAEMAQIAELEAKRRGFGVSEDAKEKILSICSQVAQRPDAGNGRFCRNLIENAILSYAQRVYGEEGSPAEKDFILIGEDFTLPEEFVPVKVKKDPIGFLSAS